MFQEAKFSVENREKEIKAFIDDFDVKWRNMDSNFVLPYTKCTKCGIHKHCLSNPVSREALCEECSLKEALKVKFKEED